MREQLVHAKRVSFHTGIIASTNSWSCWLNHSRSRSRSCSIAPVTKTCRPAASRRLGGLVARDGEDRPALVMTAFLSVVDRALVPIIELTGSANFRSGYSALG